MCCRILVGVGSGVNRGRVGCQSGSGRVGRILNRAVYILGSSIAPPRVIPGVRAQLRRQPFPVGA